MTAPRLAQACATRPCRRLAGARRVRGRALDGRAAGARCWPRDTRTVAGRGAARSGDAVPRRLKAARAAGCAAAAAGAAPALGARKDDDRSSTTAARAEAPVLRAFPPPGCATCGSCRTSPGPAARGALPGAGGGGGEDHVVDDAAAAALVRRLEQVPVGALVRLEDSAHILPRDRIASWSRPRSPDSSSGRWACRSALRPVRIRYPPTSHGQAALRAGNRPGHHRHARADPRRPAGGRGQGLPRVPAALPQAGWVEHDLDGDLDRRSSGCIARGAATTRGIDGQGRSPPIGITNQRETTGLWDRDTGKPLHRAIVWQDRRTADICAELKAAGRRSRGCASRPGWCSTRTSPAPSSRWLLDHVEGAARPAPSAGELCFGTIDTWLVYRLTGGAAHVTDVVQRQPHAADGPDGAALGRRDARAVRRPARVLPEIRGSAEVYGTTAGLKSLPDGIPVRGMAGDQQAALFGQACFAARARRSAPTAPARSC